MGRTPALLAATLVAAALAQAQMAPGTRWLPGRLSLRFLEAPLIGQVEGRLDLGEGLREILAELPEARLEPLYPDLRRPTVPDLSLSYVLTVDPARDIPALAARCEATGQLEYAEPDWLLPLRRTPSDPLFGSQWALEKVEARAAWDWLPEPSGNPPMVIAIIDSGVQWTHLDLRQRMWVNPGEDLDGDGAPSPDFFPGDPDDRNGVDDDGNGKIDDFYGWDWIDNLSNCQFGEDCDVTDNNPMDFNGHGTVCAGAAAAQTDNGEGIASLAWDARVMALRCGYSASDGNGYIVSSAAANAISYAIEHGAKIISMSFGGSGTLRTPATAAWNAGLLCFHAATVGEGPQDQLDRATGMVSVVPSDSLDCVGACGDWVDLAAPGVDVLGLTLFGYGTSSGSSVACPLAASLAALVWPLHTDWTNAELRERLLATADPLDGWPCNEGCPGRINARRALENDTGLGRVTALRPQRSRLTGAAPNPFNPLTRVAFELAEAGDVRLTACNLLGQEVALLLEGGLAAGAHTALFDGAALPSGLYLLRLEVDGRLVDQGKTLLLK